MLKFSHNGQGSSFYQYGNYFSLITKNLNS